MPTAGAVSKARELVGMQHVILDPTRFTIRFAKPGIMLDLGSIGKGYALDVAVETLTEAGVEHALIHGGTSTVCAVGHAPEGGAWKVAIDAPPIPGQAVPADSTGPEPIHQPPLAVVELDHQSLSVSAVHGKAFTADGVTYGHVIDPRSGRPAQGAALAAVIMQSAGESDAFSTALLLAGIEGEARMASARPGIRTLVADRSESTGELQTKARGITPLTTPRSQ
jgi:thiamine biosynthesis lipoprotein